MGQNRRYQLVERDVERAGQAATRTPRPISLTIDEVAATGVRRDATTPVPVVAQVLHQVAYVESRQIEAEAIAWTNKAVLLRWTEPGAAFPTHAWVYAAAVTRS